MPSESLIREVVDVLRIPYIPYWSFGERLPAIEESSADPAGLAYAYELLARLVVSKVDWNEALNGRAMAPPLKAERRTLDEQWASRHRAKALTHLSSISAKAHVELYHCSVDAAIDKPQDQLLTAARQAATTRSGWPIGAVLDDLASRPRPSNEGVIAEIDRGYVREYWILTTRGDFFSINSLHEDNYGEGLIFIDTRITYAAEAIIHCAKLYQALGTGSKATIQLRLGYSGILGRHLKRSGPFVAPPIESVNKYENASTTEIIFRLDEIESHLVELVKKLCVPFFLLFDFYSPTEQDYERLISSLIEGKTK